MKESIQAKNSLRLRRVIRARAKVFGTAVKPRLAVFRSLKHLSIQAIDDQNKVTLAAAYDTEVKTKSGKERAKETGKLLAKKLLDKKISQAVFDKRHYKYHGLIKELADGAREGGLKF